MVWNQYVYEAMNGSEAYNSENEDENNIEEPLHITDWELIYQEELRYMWANIQQYLYDSSFSGLLIFNALVILLLVSLVLFELLIYLSIRLFCILRSFIGSLIFL